MKRILLAFQFLTIIPVKDIGEVPDREAGGSSAFFPLVGLIEGTSLLILSALFLRVFPTELTNGLLVLFMVVVNGGLHLDGLSDTFDAIASRGDKERKLAIMKESTVGPMGVIAIVMVLLLKYLMLNAVFFNSNLSVYFSAVFLMPVLSRWTLVPALYHGRAAKEDGLGRTFIKYTEKKEVLIATMLALIISIVKISAAAQFSLLAFIVMFIMPLLYIYGFGAVWFSNKYFEGMTGDIVGAVYEIAVLLVLIMFCIRSAI